MDDAAAAPRDGPSHPRRDRRPRARHAATALIGVALVGAVVLQRHTATSAIGELGALGAATLLALAGLVLVDRVVRGLMIRRAVGGITRIEGVVMHDVGAAASYGLPGGGVVGTGLRYQVARRAQVDGATFLAGLTAYGLAITVATWLLPLGVLALETVRGDTGLLDVSLMAVCVLYLSVLAVLWTVVLRSDRLFERVVSIGEWARRRLGRWRTVRDFDVRHGLVTLRDRLRLALPGIGPLVIGALVMHLVAAGILLVTLYGLGATGDLGVLEFARIFFVTRVVGSLAPTPGGVGVIEAGMTAAIASAGVPLAAAAAGVLVFRLATYVVPIISGAGCWFLWRRRTRVGCASQEVFAT